MGEPNWHAMNARVGRARISVSSLSGAGGAAAARALTIPSALPVVLTHALALALALALSLSIALAGCSTFQYAPQAKAFVPPTPIAPGHWPARDMARAQAELDATPEELRTVVIAEPPTSVTPVAELGAWQDSVRDPVARVVHKELIGEGLLRVFDNAPPGAGSRASISPPTSASTSASVVSPSNQIPAAASFPPRLGTMRFVSFSTQEIRPVDERADMLLQFTHSQSQRLRELGLDAKPNDPRIVSMLRDGIRMRLSNPIIEPLGEPAEPVGLVLFMPGLGSRQYVQPVVDELRRRGWCVLSIETPRVWWYQPVAFELNTAADIEPTAERIAKVIDDQMAEPAYAAEAGLRYVKLVRPDLDRKPVVLMGFSAGAIFAPAVGARLHDQLAAVVLIGGGGNVLKISQTSDLTNGGLELKWPAHGPRTDWRERLFEHYLKHAHLDPANAARAITDVPALVSVAEFDTTVPADCGWLLASRLPNADRLNFALGHRLMFWKLANRSADIADWVEGAVQRPIDGHNATETSPAIGQADQMP